jgi:hypothetical protein
MIARSWHGKVPTAKALVYHQYLLDTGLNDYAAIKGNRGGFLFKRQEGNITHFQTPTFWDDYGAIKEFAGPDYEKARYYPEDKDYLLEFEVLVTHSEVLEKWQRKCN